MFRKYIKRKRSDSDDTLPQEALEGEEQKGPEQRDEVKKKSSVREIEANVRWAYIFVVIFGLAFFCRTYSFPIKFEIDRQEHEKLIEPKDFKNLCVDNCNFRFADENSVRRVIIEIVSTNENLICRMDTNDVVISLQNDGQLYDTLFRGAVGINNLPQRNTGCMNLDTLVSELSPEYLLPIVDKVTQTVESKTARARFYANYWELLLFGSLMLVSLIIYLTFRWRKWRRKMEQEELDAAKTISQANVDEREAQYVRETRGKENDAIKASAKVEMAKNKANKKFRRGQPTS